MARPHLRFPAVLFVVAILGASLSGRTAQRGAGGVIPIDPDDIGGVVRGAKGPEAGVWVIAETTDLPTKFVRIVVTDDRGRYLVPDLPKASYNVWVRGYGLVDSPKVKARTGTAAEPDGGRRAQRRAPPREYYPAGYWFSLLRVPDKSEFPGTGPAGNGIAPAHGEPGAVAASAEVRRLHGVPSARATRRRARFRPSLGTFASSAAAWERRMQSGQAGAQMINGAEPARAASARWRCSPTGPTASRRAKCRRRRRGRKGSSATS